MDVEQGTFTPLVFTTTGGMGEECMRYHNRPTELVAAKKGEDYATTVSWIRSKVSFASLGRLYSVLEGHEQLKEQLEVMFKKRTLKLIDSLPKSRSYIFFIIFYFLFSLVFSFVVQYYNNSSKECPEFLKKNYSPQMRGSSNVVYIIQYCLFIFSQCTESIFPTDYKSLNLIIILQ